MFNVQGLWFCALVLLHLLLWYAGAHAPGTVRKIERASIVVTDPIVASSAARKMTAVASGMRRHSGSTTESPPTLVRTGIPPTPSSSALVNNNDDDNMVKASSTSANRSSTTSMQPPVASTLSAVGKRNHTAPLIIGEEDVSRCPDEEIYVALWALIRKPSRWTIVDVGANKGYSVAGILEALNVSWFSRAKVGLAIYRFAEEHSTTPVGLRHTLCGACCDCTMGSPWEALAMHDWVTQRRRSGGSGERRMATAKGGDSSNDDTDGDSQVYHTKAAKGVVASDGQNPPSVTGDAAGGGGGDDGGGGAMPYTTRDIQIEGADLWLFDGTRAHTQFTKHFFTKENAAYRLQYPNASQFEFHFEHKAVSKKEGTSLFPQTPLGVEDSSLGKGENVSVVSLGSYLPASIDTIDVLLTDTEGHDFDVYEGIYDRFLKPGKVGIYIFEIHYGPNNRTLFSIVQELYAAGYMCYFPLSGHTVKIHGKKKVIGQPTKRHVVPISAHHWLPWYEQLRGWANVVCANERRFPELRRIFKVLQKLPRPHWFQDCGSKRIYRDFLSRYPNRNWAWALT